MIKNITSVLFSSACIVLLCSCTSRPEVIVLQRGEILVQRGDTIHDIAKQHQVFLQELIELNGLTPPYSLKENQKLRLPDPVKIHPQEETKREFFQDIEGKKQCSVNSGEFNNGPKIVPMDIKDKKNLQWSTSSNTSLDSQSAVAVVDRSQQEQREFQGEPVSFQDPDGLEENIKNTNIPLKESLENSKMPQMSQQKNSAIKEDKTSNGPQKDPKILEEKNQSHQTSMKNTPYVSKNAFLRRPVTHPLGENFSEETSILKYKIPQNTAILSPGAGKIIFVGDDVNGNNGKQVVIQHKNGFLTSITGLKNPCVQNDQDICSGQSLGQAQQGYIAMELINQNQHHVNPLHYFAKRVAAPPKRKNIQ